VLVSYANDGGHDDDDDDDGGGWCLLVLATGYAEVFQRKVLASGVVPQVGSRGDGSWRQHLLRVMDWYSH